MGAPATAQAPRGFLARADRLEIAIGVISLVGIAVAGYLTYIHYAGIEPLCAAGGGGCHKVQNSVYAELVGIPVAVLGLAGYLAIADEVLERLKLRAARERLRPMLAAS